MIERENILTLYEIYKKLLTDKQRLYFEEYYYEDLSMQEAADNHKVSKAYVGKIINETVKKLVKYEELLCINSKNESLRKIANNLDKEVKEKIENILEK